MGLFAGKCMHAHTNNEEVDLDSSVNILSAHARQMVLFAGKCMHAHTNNEEVDLYSSVKIVSAGATNGSVCLLLGNVLWGLRDNKKYGYVVW